MLFKQLSDFGQRSGHQVAALSIGAMRLPKNTDKAIALLRSAIDRGLRYIDTSRGYGESEFVVGRALKDGYRDKVILSTKWSPWITKIDEGDDSSSDCVRRRLEESMLRLDVVKLRVKYQPFVPLVNIVCHVRQESIFRQ